MVEDTLRSPGQPLESTARTFMELRFGRSFGGVRVHADARAAESARDISASAYTVGEHVVFAKGMYDPGTAAGKRLLAHELTHVVQQSRGGRAPTLGRATPHEREAETASAAVAAGAQFEVGAAGTDVGLARNGLPALSAEELMTFLHSQRGFGTSTPGPPAIDPKLIGKPTGKGYQTYAAIQIVDPAGKQVKVSIGAYLGGGQLHGETAAINAMRGSLTGVDVTGGKMMVAVEQLPCQGCDSQIKAFARELKLDSYEVYVPERAQVVDPTKVTKPKTAATSVFQGERPPTKPKLVDSQKLGGPPPTAGPGPTGARGGPAAVPAERVPSASGAARSGMKPPTAAPTNVSTEARAIARDLAKTASTDLRLLRTARVLTAALHVIQFVGALKMLDDFVKMSESGLAGKGFILTKAIAQAQELDKSAAELARSYPAYSDSLQETGWKLYLAGADAAAAGQLAAALGSLDSQLLSIANDLDDQIARIDKAHAEASAKRKAAQAILEDPTASGALGGIFGGTAELATLFAAWQDLERIEGALRRASTSLGTVRGGVKADRAFVSSWYDYHFAICLKAGVCSQVTLQIPLGGPVTVRITPGSE